MNPQGSRYIVRSAVALAVVGATALGAAPAASAQVVLPLPFPTPVVGFGRPQPPRPCNEQNDGLHMRWDGWLWQCTWVWGGIPPWRWEPIRELRV